MARKRMSVRKIREILRLHFDEKRSNREAGTSVGKSASVVHDCLKRFEASGVGWPLGEEVDDEALEKRLYAPAGQNAASHIAQPDFEYVHKELARKHVTLVLLWQEYRAVQSDGWEWGQSMTNDIYFPLDSHGCRVAAVFLDMSIGMD